MRALGKNVMKEAKVARERHGPPQCRPLVGMLVFGLLSACATVDTINNTDTTDKTAEYQSRLVRSLSNQREVSFSDAANYPGDILCGRYEALDDDGFRSYTSDYIVGPNTLLSRPSDTQVAVYCSQDPETELYEQLGIGGDDGNWPAVGEISADMLAIQSAIEAYYASVNMMPRDLNKLLAASTGQGSGSLTPQNLLDPWGNPYQYIEGLAGRSAPQYKLFTLGADGAAGGTGQDADIREPDLPLIQHVLQLRSLNSLAGVTLAD